jgi:hypothetical protein
MALICANRAAPAEVDLAGRVPGEKLTQLSYSLLLMVFSLGVVKISPLSLSLPVYLGTDTTVGKRVG